MKKGMLASKEQYEGHIVTSSRFYPAYLHLHCSRYFSFQLCTEDRFISYAASKDMRETLEMRRYALS